MRGSGGAARSQLGGTLGSQPRGAVGAQLGALKGGGTPKGGGTAGSVKARAAALQQTPCRQMF